SFSDDGCHAYKQGGHRHFKREFEPEHEFGRYKMHLGRFVGSLAARDGGIYDRRNGVRPSFCATTILRTECPLYGPRDLRQIKTRDELFGACKGSGVRHVVDDDLGRRTRLSPHYVNYLMAEGASRAEYFHLALAIHGGPRAKESTVTHSP